MTFCQRPAWKGQKNPNLYISKIFWTLPSYYLFRSIVICNDFQKMSNANIFFRFFIDDKINLYISQGFGIENKS